MSITSSSLVVGHILFMDVVGYTRLYIDEQLETINKLEEAVRQTEDFKRYQKTSQLTPLPSGDGIALVFFEDILSPVRCAVEISQDLPQLNIKLRMGIHSGPLYRRTAINQLLNVTGSGINNAQRVMDFGDAGHILLSDRAASDLLELREWQSRLSRLGKAFDKHNIEHLLYNLCFDDIGNSNLPQKIRDQAFAASKQDDAPYNVVEIPAQEFIGREWELEKLRQILIEQSGNKLCSITGKEITGGVGKTTLAHYFAQTNKQSFSDGVITMPVGNHTSSAESPNIDALARDFILYCNDKTITQNESATMTMRRVFSGRRMLLIFDNASYEELRDLIPGGDKCAVIITTRRRDLVDSLNVPSNNRITLDVLSDDEAKKLIGTIIGDERIKAEPEAVRKIIASVSNLPLALKIVGLTLLERQGENSLARYAKELEDKKDVLRKIKFSTDINLDLRASIALSLIPLDDIDRQFFAKLNVCSEKGFTVRAAMAAVGCGEQRAQEGLDKLYFLSLINIASSSPSGQARYIFHPLIKLYTQHLADNTTTESGSFLIDEARADHASFYEDLIMSNAIYQSPEIIRDELDEIIIAAKGWEKRQAGGDKVIQRMLNFFEQHGHWEQAVELIASLVRTAEQSGNKEAAANHRISLGAALRDCKDFTRALDELAPIEGIIRRINQTDKRLDIEARWKNTLGTVLFRLGRFEEAEQAIQACITIREETSNTEGLGYALNNLVTLYHRQNRLEEAEMIITRVNEIRRALGDPKNLGHSLQSQAGVLLSKGDLEGAERTYREALELFDSYPRGQAMARTGLGRVFLNRGDFKEAIKQFEFSLEIEESLDNDPGVALVKTEIGKAWLFKGNKPEEAVKYLAAAFNIEERKKNRKGLEIITPMIVKALKRLGRNDDALSYIERSKTQV